MNFTAKSSFNLEPVYINVNKCSNQTCIQFASDFVEICTPILLEIRKEFPDERITTQSGKQIELNGSVWCTYDDEKGYYNTTCRIRMPFNNSCSIDLSARGIKADTVNNETKCNTIKNISYVVFTNGKYDERKSARTYDDIIAIPVTAKNRTNDRYRRVIAGIAHNSPAYKPFTEHTEISDFAYRLNTEIFKLKINELKEDGTQYKLCYAKYNPDEGYGESISIFNKAEGRTINENYSNIVINLFDSEKYGRSIKVIVLDQTEDEKFGIQPRDIGDKTVSPLTRFVNSVDDIQNFVPPVNEILNAIHEWKSFNDEFEPVLDDGELPF